MKRKTQSGPDPDFPYLGVDMRFSFPPPRQSPGNIVAVGGNLSPGMLLSAYEQGIFPWYNREDPLLWQSPDPRFIIFPEKLHVSSSMKKVFRKNEFDFALDKNFEGVIRSCAEALRPGQGGTWITKDIIDAYTELHRLGFAHSAESYFEGCLAGGCYGIRLGGIFFGESMFAKKSNASKAAFLHLARFLFDDGVMFIDCQVHTDHLESLGGEVMAREDFLDLLHRTLGNRPPQGVARDKDDRRGNWSIL
ncbi:leucyl/phenylalanyl-tRNA--protein transferase [Spirochaetia bacterium]|nr:leucyl/phenylalanyl-tRNA--protein transferase [Spirochaetia bacterium]